MSIAQERLERLRKEAEGAFFRSTFDRVTQVFVPSPVPEYLIGAVGYLEYRTALFDLRPDLQTQTSSLALDSSRVIRNLNYANRLHMRVGSDPNKTSFPRENLTVYYTTFVQPADLATGQDAVPVNFSQSEPWTDITPIFQQDPGIAGSPRDVELEFEFPGQFSMARFVQYRFLFAYSVAVPNSVVININYGVY